MRTLITVNYPGHAHCFGPIIKLSGKEMQNCDASKAEELLGYSELVDLEARIKK